VVKIDGSLFSDANLQDGTPAGDSVHAARFHALPALQTSR
jgi:hypothetical protein